jgi:hypothetical protein
MSRITKTTAVSRAQLRISALIAFVLLFALVFAPSGSAQTTQPLNFGNNYFVTGDYAVGGVGLRGLGQLDTATGRNLATGTISLPDTKQPNPMRVPDGAQVVAAFLYWETVESTTTGSPTGQNGFFRPLYTNGPQRYAITGVILGNPNAPISWSSGGCSGNSQGSKTMRAYRADVRAMLPQDANGNILANGTYEVTLPDSGSNGGGTPLTLGATLVIIYRVISPNFPLNAIVIYDDAFAPSNGSTTMTEPIRGFYQAAANPVAKLTHIVGNGQANKYQTVQLNGVNLPSPYGSAAPAFPGLYNGSWDNPTWVFNTSGNPVHEDDATATTAVVPSSSNGGCVSWGAVIFSTTVKDTDGDGLLDVWEDTGGYYDALDNTTWIPLPNACSGGPHQSTACAPRTSTKDLFVQLDYLCSGAIDATGKVCTGGHSHYPLAPVISDLTKVFAGRGISVQITGGNAIQEQTCTDTSTLLCPYPNQAGVIGWKLGFEFLKNQPIGINPSTGAPWTEADCETNVTTCQRRFPHGQKDSYHYVVFGHALGRANWSFAAGTLTGVSVASNGAATFTVSTPTGLTVSNTAGNGRVTVANAIAAPGLNGTFFVTGVNDQAAPYTFSIQTTNVATGNFTSITDPNLAVASGVAGSGSGISDRGGADSLITLGLWGAAGTTVPVQEGTLMHEIGHTFGLTHGGYSYDPNKTNNYVASIGPNCEPNYLSVMNYLFQVDLLDGKYLDYSGQQLSPVNEGLGFSGGLTTATGDASTYSTTTWFTADASTLPGTPSAAKRHCDGTPITDGATMYRVVGATAPVSWPASDLNFDGISDENFAGSSDWAILDLRQIGATGSDLVGAGINGGWGGINGGWGGINGGWGGINGGWGGINGGWGGINGGWGGINGGWGGVSDGEITFEIASSSVRPPTALMGDPHDKRTSHSVSLNWTAPTFGQVLQYNVYRTQFDTNTTTKFPVIGPAPGTTYTDSSVSACTTYTYLVTALFQDVSNPTGPALESTPTNSFVYSVPCPASNLNGTRSQSGVTLTWTTAPTPSGAPVSYTVYGYNVYRDADTTPLVASSPYTDTSATDNLAHTYYLTAVVTDQQGCSPDQYCRESSQISTTIKGASVTTITSTNPNPSILGQSITVNFTVSPAGGSGAPTGSVTVSDGSGATCTGTLSQGKGSCLLALTAYLNGKALVGTRTLTATYPGDNNFTGSVSAPFNQKVYYIFTGFLPQLTAAGDTSYSGAFNLSKSITTKWTLSDFNGNFLGDLSANVLYAVGPLSTISGKCPLPFQAPLAKAASWSLVSVLYSPTTGAKGGSTFRIATSNNQFIFNWDTKISAPGCYILELDLNSGQVERTGLQLQ